MARRSRAKCGGEFTRNKSSNQEPQAIRAMRMVATQAGNTMIWMMVASLARVISTLPTMSKLLRCQAARAWIRWSRWGRHCWRWCFVDGKTQRRSVESGDASGDNGGGNRAETDSDAHAREQANAYAVVSDGSTELKEEQPSRRQLRRREAAERRSGTRGDENPMKPVQRAGRGRRWCCFDGKSRTQQRGLVKRVKVPVDP
ncbi:hypothetical protein PC117_g6974 [Phytophthora cactorum]|uniref:Uncharacterized protein n=1 Tax=Phytophthora cactorum TaxID=29920 RepID=A0A8T1DZM5_9STRA|nr:hypothetical protein PC117_g6974 [Phytophthora cactorum]